VQDEVSQAIVALLAPAVTGQEQKRLLTQKKTSNLSAWDLYLQGLGIYNGDDANYEDVIQKCEDAIELDNDFCDAYVLVCRCLFGKVFSNEYAHKRAENEALFHEMANKAYNLDPNTPEAVIALSRSFNIKRDYDKRIELAERALELNPNHPACNHDYGLAITNIGRFDDALDHIFKAMKMDPARQRQYDFILPLVYMAMHDSENALKYAKEHHNYKPHSRYEGYLAAIYANSGDLDMARTHLAKFLEQRPEVKTLADYEKVVPTICKDFMLSGLAKAGLPDA
jgi:adenylate cyclase